MLTKIKRQDCLDQLPKFPQREYDRAKDEDIFSYPRIHSLYWVKLEQRSKRAFTKKLVTEIVLLFKELEIDKLIFLGDTTQAWISKTSLERTDYKPLVNALAYLADNKIGRRFNGAIQVNALDLFVFLQHIYVMTSCDASLPYFNFMDEGQNIIGCIHYSGELRIDTLNKRSNATFLKAIKKTMFEDAYRKDSSRI